MMNLIINSEKTNNMRSKLSTALLVVAGTYFFSGSCGKDDPPPPSDPCAGVTVTVQGTKTDAGPGVNDGSITISSPSGSGVTFSLNGGSFAAASTFNNLAAGTYTITAKNANGCSGSGSFTIVTDVCRGKNITVSGSNIVTSTPCLPVPNGSVTVSATGGTGFTFNINNGTFQTSGVFGNLAAGNYTIGAKDADGCIRTSSVTIPAQAAGPLFNAVKAVIQSSCIGCHSGGGAAGGVNFSNDCVIVDKWDRIKARAVDGIPSFMPPPPSPQLSATDKQKITDWIAAGHRYTD
jgi:hypothetical protein